MSESTKTPVYQRFVRELAVLECVRATLSEWEHADMPTGTECKVSGAGLALRRSITRMTNRRASMSDSKKASVPSHLVADEATWEIDIHRGGKAPSA